MLSGAASPQFAGNRSEAGISLVEMLIAVAVLAIAAGTAILAVTNVLPTVHADSSLDMLVAQLQQTHQEAINQRRDFLVTFAGTNELTINRVNLDGTETQVGDYFMSQGMIYTVLASVPDTPDGFDSGTPANFSDGNSIVFNSDGTVVDSTGKLVNYEVFAAIPGNTTSARAVTVMGATGRVEGYRYNGSAWK